MKSSNQDHGQAGFCAEAQSPSPTVESAGEPASQTPGPWRIEGRRGAGYIISAGTNAEGDGPENYVGVLDPMFFVAGEGVERREADARLIAAAPDLLAALKDCALEIAQIHNRKLTAGEQAALDAARRAIARVEGSAQ